MAEITKQDTHDKVIALVADKLSINKTSIAPQATLLDLGADSIDLVKIIMGLEESFGITIDDEKAEKLNTISDVVEYVHSLRIEKSKSV